MIVLKDDGLDAVKKDKLYQLLDAVRKYYSLAEKQLKLIEVEDNQLAIPAINQLRYAGCHLSRACVTPDIDDVLRDLDKAQRHCKRAIYDSLEVGITYHLELIAQFQDDYRNTMITPVIPNYIALSEELSEISKYLGSPRDFAREQYWIECSKIYERVREIHLRLTSSRQELNKALASNNVSIGRYRITLSVAVIAIIVTITIAML